MTNNKIILFTSSSLALPLINYLFSKNMLACVVFGERASMDKNIVLQNIIAMNIPYFQFDSKNDNVNIEIFKKIDSKLGLLFTFPHKLSNNILEYFKDNIFNIHASPLPKYRGAQPVFWQIRNGEQKSALTIHKVDKKFDNGDFVIQKEFDINSKDTMGMVLGLISQLTVIIVEEFLKLLESGDLSASAQIGEITKAPNIKQKDLLIDWENMNSNNIINLVRASNPIFGGAKTIWKNSYINILEATNIDMDNLGLDSGYILHIGYPEGLIVATIDGAVRFDIVSVHEGVFSGLRFSKRFNLEAGERFSS